MKDNSRWAKSNLTDRFKWLGLAGSSGGPLVQTLLQQGHPEQAAQAAHVRAAFEDFQGWRLYNLHHPHKKEVLPGVQRKPPLLQFVRMASCPVTEHH